MNDDKLKECPGCGIWFSGPEIIADPYIKPVGMCFQPNEPQIAYFYFKHDLPECGASFIVPVAEFREYVHEEIPAEVKAGQGCCENHCTNIEDLALCGQDCFNAPFRKFLMRLLELKESAKSYTDKNQPSQ